MEGPQIELSDIQRFYKDSTVFLTGATGFIGKLFLEKVLRALPVKKVYILVRTKKDVPAAKRFQDIFESPVFDLLKRTNPTALDKVEILEGDCSLPMVGLSEQDIETFVQNVNVIFHCAATVRFDEKIKHATRTNVRSTKDLVDLAKKIPKLRTFVYVGTAYSNSNRLEIREEIYPAKITAEKLITVCESLDDECLNAVTDKLIGDWPNTYTFTKQVSEDYINRVGRDIPICIERPAVVISTAEEPMSAFVDNVYTLAGFVMSNVVGISRITYYKNTNLDMVPADYVVNHCIAAGWLTGDSFKKQRSEIPVYQISNAIDNPISQDDIYDIVDYECHKIPTPKLVVLPLYFRTTCRYNYLFFRFFFHTLIAHMVDFVLKVKGKKPMLVKGMKKLHAFQEANEPFSLQDFFIHVENTNKLLKKMSFKDRELFNFDVARINWEDYFAQYVRGLRFYLLKDTMDTVAEGFKKYRVLKITATVYLIIAAIVIYGLGKVFLFRAVPLVWGVVAHFLRNLVC
ncbi:unnamed protein product [Ceutorhynchus assimilis]|uniref:Fatty acyl-CoA reductase n=1 Tax=Ceutorhynchus assimilis TaxID=467358 RepID=A0A9N9MTX3_9CUCU|nr:unnamed protein product [Ceutorhynchus assimilis]